jgi:hypothetical protein
MGERTTFSMGERTTRSCRVGIQPFSMGERTQGRRINDSQNTKIQKQIK